MGAGTKRNGLCWCNSGLKYKKCHLNRAEQEPVKRWQAEKVFRDTFRKEVCSAPAEWAHSCSGKIIRAHTVPKSGSLRKIERAGHVYAFVPSLNGLTQHNGRLVPELTGVNSASTFTGFCSHHDDRIFAPIEKVPFTGSQEQCFLLGYRAIARELFTKERSMDLDPLRRSADRGGDADRQMAVQAFNFMMQIGLQAGLNDIRPEKSRYDADLVARDFARVRAYVIETANPPPVMCAAGWMPSWDLDGNRLQDLSNLVPASAMTCTSFWGGGQGVIVFQWMERDDDICSRFIASLVRIPDDRLGSTLVRLMFENFENLHIAPDWWEGLPLKSREALIDLMSVGANPFATPPDGAPKEVNIDLPSLPIARRYSVGWELASA